MVRRTRLVTSAVTTEDMCQPIQSRAQVTLDRICEAALVILSEGGWDAFNTNVVAARAGVSGPTVYRYFPNKYVLAAELRRRLDDAESRAVLPAIGRIGDAKEVQVPVGEWVDALARVRTQQPAALLLRSMSAAVPDLSRSDADPDDVLAALTAALRRRQPTLTPDEAAEWARAIRTLVDAIIDDANWDGGPSARQIGLTVDLATTMIDSASGARAEVSSGRAES